MNLLLLIGAFLIFQTQNAESAMTDQQLKAAMKLIRNVCQPKFKTTSEQIEAMHKGDWDSQDKAGRCYMWCIMNMYKLITKENKFDTETAITTLSVQAPDSIKESAIASVKNCKDAITNFDDKCEAGFQVGRCLYNDNPEKYFLP